MATMSPGSERDDGEELGDDAVKLILRLKKVHHCSDCMKMPGAPSSAPDPAEGV